MFDWLFKPKTCLVCIEKDKRIAHVNSQIDRHFSLTEKMVSPGYNYAIGTQANMALEGAGQTKEPEQVFTDDEIKQLSAVEKQALSLLTGTY